MIGRGWLSGRYRHFDFEPQRIVVPELTVPVDEAYFPHANFAPPPRVKLIVRLNNCGEERHSTVGIS